MQQEIVKIDDEDLKTMLCLLSWGYNCNYQDRTIINNILTLLNYDCTVHGTVMLQGANLIEKHIHSK